MTDDEAFDALAKLGEWGWRKPAAVSKDEFERMFAGCVLFLTDRPTESKTGGPVNLEHHVERSHRRLMQYLPDFRKQYDNCDADQQNNLIKNAVDWSESRFERMIINHEVDQWRRIYEAGLCDKSLNIDDLILRVAQRHWQKVAMIVGTVMCARAGLADTLIAERVLACVESGQLEAQGDLSQMRYSEVRRPAD